MGPTLTGSGRIFGAPCLVCPWHKGCLYQLAYLAEETLVSYCSLGIFFHVFGFLCIVKSILIQVYIWTLFLDSVLSLSLLRGGVIYQVNYVSAHDNETLFDIVSLKVLINFSLFLALFLLILIFCGFLNQFFLSDSIWSFCRRQVQDKSFGYKYSSTLTGSTYA